MLKAKEIEFDVEVYDPLIKEYILLKPISAGQGNYAVYLGQKVKTAESARLRAEKEKSLTEEHNSWLQSELEKKSEELFRARREDAENVAGSRKKIEDLVSEKGLTFGFDVEKYN